MLFTISLILASLVVLNIFLLIFSCNSTTESKHLDIQKVEKMEKETTIQPQDVYFAPTGS